MPKTPDELDEIKRLLDNSVTNKPASSEKTKSDMTETELVDAPKNPGEASDDKQSDIDILPVVEAELIPPPKKTSPQKQGGGQKALPPATQKPGAGRSGPPATTQKPGMVRSGPPATIKKPGAGRSGLPATTKKPGTGRSGLPATTKKPGTGRSGLPATIPKPDADSSDLPIKIKKPGMEITYTESEIDESTPIVNAKPITDKSMIIKYEPPPRSKTTDNSEAEPDVGSDKFKVKFDFDGAYMDIPERKPIRVRRERRTGCIGGILYAAFVISVSLVLASLLWMAAVDVLGFGAEDEEVNVTVQQGFEIEDITEMLYDAGLIRYKFLFNLYAGYSNAEEKITAGSYTLNMNHDYRALVQGMTARAGVRVETTVTIPEGFTLAQIFALLEDYGVCPADELWEAATYHNFNNSFISSATRGNRYRLEGYLFPETYNFYVGSKPEQAINIFLREFNKRFTEQLIERAEDMGYSVRDIIIIASMIEREAGDDEERPRIAAVIYNRLDSSAFPHLQIDATIHYAIAGTGRTFSTDIDSPYNTYNNEGLPPGPISNPGMASIRAALYPDSTNEYYYALNRSGTHDFFRTREQHEAFVNSDEYGG